MSFSGLVMQGSWRQADRKRGSHGIAERNILPPQAPFVSNWEGYRRKQSPTGGLQGSGVPQWLLLGMGRALWVVERVLHLNKYLEIPKLLFRHFNKSARYSGGKLYH